MDIYSFINSKAISSYCRKINYKFTPIEMAYLVNENDNMNIFQKHKAFNDIINEQEDMEIANRN